MANKITRFYHALEPSSNGVLGGTIAGVERDEEGNIIGFSPEKFALGFASGAAGAKALSKIAHTKPVQNLASKAKQNLANTKIAQNLANSKAITLSQKSIQKLATNPRAKAILEKIQAKSSTNNDKMPSQKLATISPEKTQKGQNQMDKHIKMNTKTKDYLNDLPLSTQDDFNIFVDNVLNKNYEKDPNIQRIATINARLQETLELQGNKVFMLKSSLAHLRPERKAKYKQALEISEIKELPSIINKATTAYKDDTGFFITFADKNNEKMMNFIHFKSDGRGNFIVTAKKADKRILKNKKPIGDGS